LWNRLKNRLSLRNRPWDRLSLRNRLWDRLSLRNRLWNRLSLQNRLKNRLGLRNRLKNRLGLRNRLKNRQWCRLQVLLFNCLRLKSSKIGWLLLRWTSSWWTWWWQRCVGLHIVADFARRYNLWLVLIRLIRLRLFWHDSGLGIVLLFDDDPLRMCLGMLLQSTLLF